MDQRYVHFTEQRYSAILQILVDGACKSLSTVNMWKTLEVLIVSVILSMVGSGLNLDRSLAFNEITHI